MARPPWLTPPAARPDGAPQPPAFNVPPATLVLALALVAIYAALQFLPALTAAVLGEALSFNAARLHAALDGRAALWPALTTLVSHMFLHYDAVHVAVNVGFLFAFASPVERRLGAARFLLLFLASGIAGALFETWFFPDAATLGVPMIGASGGVMGLMGTALLTGLGLPAHPGQRVDPQLARRMRLALLRIVIALIGLNVVIGLLSEMGFTGPYLIGWRAHLGGFAIGLAVGGFLRWRSARLG